ncbi:MAG: hypothetical protein ABIO35_09680 [Nitrobacter sp.]
MKPKDIKQAKDPDLRSSVAAMHRAAAMARKIAIQTDTSLVVVENGQLMRISAEALREAAAKSDKKSA